MRSGEGASELAASNLVPALRSYGAEPERFSPLSKDWNQDLQDLGIEQLRRLVAGAGPRTPPTEIATERSPGDEGPEAIPGLAATSEMCQGTYRASAGRPQPNRSADGPSQHDRGVRSAG